MNTELEIVYGLLNTYRESVHNNDERISERLLRAYIYKHRADSIRKEYDNGYTVNAEVFQTMPVTITRINPKEFTATLPKINRLDENFGMFLSIEGYAIPITSDESYHLNKFNSFNKLLMQCKTNQNLLTFYIPDVDPTLNTTGESYSRIQSLKNSIAYQDATNAGLPFEQRLPVTISADLNVILYNPSDHPEYNWEKDSLPFPATRIPELMQQIIRTEFGVSAQAKKDEVQNARVDSVNRSQEEKLD